MAQMSLKQLSINKDNTTIVVCVGLAAFVIVFSLVASNALLKQRAYQSKVIGKKKIALTQIKSNVEQAGSLKASYDEFSKANPNVLGGNPTTEGEKDGENPRLVLDALPSKYDFPALATSLEKVFKPFGIDSITGVDDELAQAASSTSSSPAPIDIPFSIVMDTNPEGAKNALLQFERSIRPFQITKTTFSVTGDGLKLTVDGKTYYQPTKKFDVRSEKVK
jgi:hypothetical protein